MSELLGVALILFGLFFCVIGVFGLMVFPDVYARIHASGKVSTMGLIGLSAAAAILLPAVSLKLLALVGFLLMTSPVAAHTVANAAYRSGVPMVDSVCDELAEDPHTLHLPENRQPRDYQEDKERLPQAG